MGAASVSFSSETHPLTNATGGLPSSAKATSKFSSRPVCSPEVSIYLTCEWLSTLTSHGRRDPATPRWATVKRTCTELGALADLESREWLWPSTTATKIRSFLTRSLRITEWQLHVRSCKELSTSRTLLTKLQPRICEE